MGRVLVTESYLSNIGSAIREKNGLSSTYKPSEMASAILGIPNYYSDADEGKVVISGTLSVQGVLSISGNGEYDTTVYSQAVVSVPPVVGSKAITINGTYNASDDSLDGYSQVVVNVSGGGGGDFIKDMCEGNASRIYDASASYVASSAFETNRQWKYVELPSCKSIYNYAFEGCIYLESAIFEECVYIGPYAFSSCSRLNTISFPKCQKISGFSAFCKCLSLTEASFPMCTSLDGNGIFEGCTRLSSINFPLLETVSGGNFRNCSYLETIILPECKLVSNGAFAYCSIKLSSVELPKCISIIGGFANCSKLQNVSLPVCTLIGTNAFSYCSSLTTVYAPQVETIGSSAFYSCSKLTNITLENCTRISSSAFVGCSSLTSLLLPVCSSIGYFAFAYCIALESIYLGYSSVVTTANSIFYGTPMVSLSYLGHYGSVYVPASLVDAYKVASYWSSIADRITAMPE